MTITHEISLFFSDQSVKNKSKNIGIIYSELFSYKSTLITHFFLFQLRSLFLQSNAFKSSFDGFTSPQLLDASKCLHKLYFVASIQTK